jgi:hypothetical protein
MKRGAYYLSALLLFLLGAPMIVEATGRTLSADPESYRQLLRELKPGDTLRLAAGEYRQGLPVRRLEGTRDAPIVIRGPAAPAVAVFIARPGANTVSILDSAHIVIRDLTLDGRNVPVDGVKAEGHARFAHHITLENLTIINHGAYQANVAISTKCPAWGWVIRGNRIHRAGTGMYLGNSDGSRAFYDGLIENNLVTDPLGYAIQIKHQHARESLAIAPHGRFVTIIRHNVLSKSNGGSSGQAARPNLLVGHWPRTGEGSEDEYLIYGNFLHDNPHEALFQGEGNIAFYTNVLLNTRGPGIHIQPHNDVPRDVRILHNTIITSGDPIVVRLGENPPSTAQWVKGNALFAPLPARGGIQIANLKFSLDQAAATLAAVDSGRLPLDPYPKNARLKCAPVLADLFEALVDGGCDFNGRSRVPGYCGAYAGSGRNPGWLPAREVKPRTICRASVPR